tara:strand:- start:705 stop:1583 length:879 start_codon:yes stop_codon:yes gene_type:complete
MSLYSLNLPALTFKKRPVSVKNANCNNEKCLKIKQGNSKKKQKKVTFSNINSGCLFEINNSSPLDDPISSLSQSLPSPSPLVRTKSSKHLDTLEGLKPKQEIPPTQTKQSSVLQLKTQKNVGIIKSKNDICKVLSRKYQTTKQGYKHIEKDITIEDCSSLADMKLNSYLNDLKLFNECQLKLIKQIENIDKKLTIKSKEIEDAISDYSTLCNKLFVVEVINDLKTLNQYCQYVINGVIGETTNTKQNCIYFMRLIMNLKTIDEESYLFETVLCNIKTLDSNTESVEDILELI